MRMAKMVKLTILNAGEHAEQPERSCIDGIAVKWYNHFGKVRQFSINVNLYLTSDPAIPLLTIYPKEMKS